MKLLLKISYLGTNYCGYQVQPNAVSVQQMLNVAAKEVFGCDCDIVGCSRTDSGVHANEFCATVSKKGTDTLETAIPCERIPLAMCAHLPEDISVFSAEWVSESFHARYDVREKEYLYRICNASVRNPFEIGRSCRLPKHIDDSALERMQKAAAKLCGTHDFSAYMAQGSKVTSTVRTITRATVVREGDMICFYVAADGFLYNMVRILTGTLVAVAEGKIDPEEIDSITLSLDRSKAGMTMPACGLYLNRVFYHEDAKKQ